MFLIGISFLSGFLCIIGIYFFTTDILFLHKKNRLLKRLKYSHTVKYKTEGKARLKGIKIPGFIFHLQLFDKLRFLLRQAGIRIALWQFLYLCFFSSILFFYPSFIFLHMYVIVFLISIAGFFVPFAFLAFKLRDRTNKIRQQLPEIISFIARSLKAGQSLDKSLHDAGQQNESILGQAIRRIQAERGFGISFDDAIANFKDNLPSIVEIKILSTAFIVQRRTGGNLAEILNNVSSIMRERLEFKMKLRVLSAESRASSIVLSILPVVFILLVYFINPDYIRILFTHELGRYIIFLAILLQAVGFLVIKLVCRVEV